MTTLALATSADDYREKVEAEMNGLNLFVAESDHPHLYVFDPNDEEAIAESAERLSEEWPVQYHTFHTYPADDA